MNFSMYVVKYVLINICSSVCNLYLIDNIFSSYHVHCTVLKIRKNISFLQQLIHASTYLWNDHNSIARSQKKNEKCDFKRMKNVTLDAPPLSPFVTFAMPTSIVQCTAHRWNLPLFHPVDLLQWV